MRIRTVKPEFWSHPVMGRMDDATKLLAIGLLNFADDEGYFYADEKLIRNALRPFDDDSTIVRRSLDHLHKIGFIETKIHPTHGNVGIVTSFLKHQRVDRPKPSIIKELYNSTTNRRLIDDESSLEGKGTGNREQGKEQGKGTGEKSPSAPEGFDEFWKAYPRKEAKAEAMKSWSKMKPDLQQVLNAISWQKNSASWTKDNGQFIPLASTYLNQRRFEDEQPKPARPMSCLNELPPVKPGQRQFPSCL